MNRWKKSIALLLAMVMVCAMALAGCSGKNGETDGTDANAEPYSKDIFAMDTYMTVSAYGEQGEKAVDSAVKEINRLDALLSTGKDTSEVSALNKNEGGDLSADTNALMDAALGEPSVGGGYTAPYMSSRLNGAMDGFTVPLSECEAPVRCRATSPRAHCNERVPLMLLHQRCAGSVLDHSSGLPPWATGTISSTTKLHGSGYGTLRSIGRPQIAHGSPARTRARCRATI